ncbi:DUF1572 family protein [Taibaiella koreensis]|uniref:DUF1572 family protein n=1 Tax=Taibaiella koreensis TaxID=1268548 RepID=UPI000E59CFB8|nr:DUF1572 family protein [Taibaiella koreensis]
MNASENFLAIGSKMFAYYKGLADKAIATLGEEEIHWRANETSNSIAIIVHHMSGNMLSRFTDFLTTDGEKTWRDRDAEFTDTYASKEEMLAAWEKGWACLSATLEGLTAADMAAIVYIRNEGHTVLEALTRQVAHYAYHSGQIVYLAKMIRDKDWQSLSIARGQSTAYNQEKFDQEKDRRFFTDGKTASS